MFYKSTSLTLFLIFLAKLLFATEFYCDPVKGSMSNDGSFSAPWSKLEDVFNSGKTFEPGDVIYLFDGYHGNVSVNGINSEYVTIKNYPNTSPKLSLLSFGNSALTSKWIVEGIVIGAEFNATFHQRTLLYTGVNASDILVRNVSIFSKEDISGWSLSDWTTKVSNGVIFKGTSCSIENSVIKNIRTGIQFEGFNCTAYNNKILNFAGDGMRGLADNGVFEYNLIQDNYVIDDNHDDGFQSWTNDGGVGKGTLKNIIIRGNTFINYTDPNRNFLGPMQGVFGTDGMFEGFVIENNIVVVDHWHGISLYGAKNCSIVNNTVVDMYFGTTYPGNPNPLGPSWIKIADHKDGTESSGNTVRNNMANQIVMETGSGIADHNLILSGNNSVDYENNFIAWQEFNFRLKQNSMAVDAGSSDQAPVIDADKNLRPEGTGFDLGAYEYASQPGEGEISDSTWKTFYVDVFSDVLTVEFDLQPHADLMDGVTGILSGTANAYTDLSCIVRLNTDGNLDVYNGDHYTADILVGYNSNDFFHITMYMDITAEKYTVYLKKNGGDEVLIAKDYQFRKSVSDLDSWAIKKENGNHSVSNMKFYSSSLKVGDEIVDENASLYPTLNNTGEFHLKTPSFSGKVTLILYDVKGRLLETIKDYNETGDMYFLFRKYRYLSPGVYIVQIRSGSKTAIIKVLKTH